MNKLKIVFVSVGVLAVLVMAGSVSAYYLYVLPKQNEEKLVFEKQKWEAEENKKREAVQLLETNNNLKEQCLDDADDVFTNGFILICSNTKIINGGDDSVCENTESISNLISYTTTNFVSYFKGILAERDKERAECFKKFSS